MCRCHRYWLLLTIPLVLAWAPQGRAQGQIGFGPFSNQGPYSIPRINSSMRPSLSLYNGQTSSLSVQSFSWAPTNVQVVQSGTALAFVPQYQPLPISYYLPMQAAMNPESGFGRLNLAPTVSRSGLGPMQPITTFIPPVFGGGAQGAAVPFTQYLPQPSFGTSTIQTSVSVPQGGYAYVGGFQNGMLYRDQFGSPFFAFGNLQFGGELNFAPFLAPQGNIFLFP